MITHGHLNPLRNVIGGKVSDPLCTGYFIVFSVKAVAEITFINTSREAEKISPHVKNKSTCFAHAKVNFLHKAGTSWVLSY